MEIMSMADSYLSFCTVSIIALCVYTVYFPWNTVRPLFIRQFGSVRLVYFGFVRLVFIIYKSKVTTSPSIGFRFIVDFQFISLSIGWAFNKIKQQ